MVPGPWPGKMVSAIARGMPGLKGDVWSTGGGGGAASEAKFRGVIARLDGSLMEALAFLFLADGPEGPPGEAGRDKFREFGVNVVALGSPGIDFAVNGEVCFC